MRTIVIGSGIVGMSLSYHLAARGAQVVALDQERPGGAASAASFACINFFNYWQPPYFQLRRDAIDYARTVAASVGAAEFLHLRGTLRWSEDPAGWEAMDRSIGALKRLGVEVEYWPAADAKRHLEPDLDFTGIRRDLVRVPGEGWMDGVPFIGRLLAAAQATGRFEWIRERAIACESDGNGIAVATEHGPVKGDVLVLASGTGTTELAATLGVNIPVHADPGVLLVSNYLPCSLRHAVYAGHVHLRPDGGGRIMAGRHGGESPPDSSSSSEALLIARQVARRLPGLSLTAQNTVLIGTRPVPKDGYPVIGWLPGQNRVYVTACHSGMTLGPLLGKLGASEILGHVEDRLAPYRPDRFEPAARLSAAAAH